MKKEKELYAVKTSSVNLNQNQVLLIIFLNPKVFNRSCYNFLLGHPVHHYWSCCDCVSCYKGMSGWKSPTRNFNSTHDSQQKGSSLLPLPLSRIFVICPGLNCRRLNINSLELGEFCIVYDFAYFRTRHPCVISSFEFFKTQDSRFKRESKN